MALVNDPQIWTLIAVFSTVLIGGFTLSSLWTGRAIAAAIGGVRAEIGGLRAEMNARFDAVNSRFDAVDSRFDAIDHKIQHLDRGAGFLMKREFGDPETL
ncbi:hypothetical protein [Microbacterium sp.]|uniref:hypothetical protein n=1 Tax=Microbacterium sp. TaxID=51671 RepID=UPI003C761C91